MLTKRTHSILVHQEHEYVGLTDDKGREIGFRTTVWRCTYVAAPNGYYARTPGVYYECSTHVTRDGTNFGALTGDFIGADLDEVLRLAKKREVASRKRYAKKFAD